MRFFKRPVFFYRGYTQALFFLTLVLYVWMSSPGSFEGSWVDDLLDGVGIVDLIAGELLRIWAVSHGGSWMRSRRIKAPLLITTGPYAAVRHPIYVGNFLIGLGMVILSEAFVFIPVFLTLFALQYGVLVSEEEGFLSEKFGVAFDRYRVRVPRYFPLRLHIRSSFFFGTNFPLKELGTAWGIIVGAFFFEWIESPLHRQWLLSFYHWLTGGISL